MLAKMLCRGKYFCKKKKRIKKTYYNINNSRKIIFLLKEWSCFLMQFCDGVCIEGKMQKNIIFHTSRSLQLVIINMEVSFLLSHMFRNTNK